MPLRQYKPTTPSRRFRTVSTYSELTTDKPEKSLLEPLKKSGGRNAQGRITARFRGGGNKRMYRIIDFRRDKYDVQGTVATIEYDPNRSSRIALVHYTDGQKRYILAPVGLKVSDKVISSSTADMARAASWCGPPARALSSWRRTASTPRSAYPLRKSERSSSTAEPPSVRSATSTMRMNPGARPARRVGWASEAVSAALR
jgi:hypothetical protein